MRFPILSLALLSPVAYGRTCIVVGVQPNGVNPDVNLNNVANFATCYASTGATLPSMAYNPTTGSCWGWTGNGVVTITGCAAGYTCYLCGDTPVNPQQSLVTATSAHEDRLRDLGTKALEFFEGLSKLSSALGATQYTFKVSIPDDYVQKYTKERNLCLWKGVTSQSEYVPVWVATNLANEVTFSWEVQYGAIWSSQDFSAGVQISSSISWDIELGDCYSIDGDNLRTKCADGDPDGLVLENTGSADRIGGMFTDVKTSGNVVGDDGHNVFFASDVMYKTGSVIIEPLEQVTIGVCSFASSALVNARTVAALYTWDVSTDGSDVLALDETSNSFSCLNTCQVVTSS